MNMKMWKCENMGLWKYGNGRVSRLVPHALTALAISIFAYFHTSTVAYCGEAVALLPVIPQPTEWKPTAGECGLASAKVDEKVDASSDRKSVV